MAVVCGLGKGRKIRFIIAFIAIIAFGAWCVRDGWFNPEYRTEEKKSDLLFSQVGAVACGVGLIIAIVKFVGAAKTRVVADEEGIDVNGKFKIAWSDLTQADDSQYERGFVKLRYKRDNEEKEYLVDSYMIDHFDDLLDEVSRRRPDVLPPAEDEDVKPPESS